MLVEWVNNCKRNLFSRDLTPRNLMNDHGKTTTIKIKVRSLFWCMAVRHPKQGGRTGGTARRTINNTGKRP